MVNFIYKTLIKDYKRVENEKVREKYGVVVGTIGVILNFSLVILKLIIGIILHSISILGDAINNLGDTFSSIINIFGFKLNNKPADKQHPYGHRRSEYIAGLLISVLMIVVALELFTSSIDKIINPTYTTISWYILLILIVNIIIKTFMAILYKDSCKKINSIALKASYKDSLNDILTTLVIVIGLYSANYFNVDLDGYLGIILSIFIVITGIKSIKEAIDKLIGESMDNERVEEILNDILTNKEILGIHDVLTHQYGEGKGFMSLHAEMDAKNTLIIAHEIIDNIERNIKRKYNLELLIHIDPIDFENKELSKVKNMIKKILYDIDANLDYHDIQIVSGKEKRLYFDLVMPYSYQTKSKQILDIVIGEITRNIKYKVSIEIHYK